MSDFFENYKRPEWQKKSAEIRERANYTCESCGATDRQLQVHHGYYEKDTRPWEYRNDSLWCLCADCHNTAQQAYNLAKSLFGRIDPKNHSEVLGYLAGMSSHRRPDYAWTPIPHEVRIGFAKAYGLTIEELEVSVVNIDVMIGSELQSAADKKRNRGGSNAG